MIVIPIVCLILSVQEQVWAMSKTTASQQTKSTGNAPGGKQWGRGKLGGGGAGAGHDRLERDDADRSTLTVDRSEQHYGLWSGFVHGRPLLLIID